MVEVGQRVMFVQADDPWTKLQPGEKGTVRFIDSLGTVHIQWDSGSNLDMSEQAGDQFRVLEEES